MKKNHDLCIYGLGGEIINIRKGGIIIAKIIDNSQEEIQIFIEMIEDFSINVIDPEKLSIKIKFKKEHSQS